MADQRDMTDLEQSVWEWLVAHHAGQDNAAPRAAIIERYNLFHLSKLSDRDFRQACADLVTYFGLAICTSAAGGYFVARDPRELGDAVADLESRAVAILERAKALKLARTLDAQGRLW